MLRKVSQAGPWNSRLRSVKSAIACGFARDDGFVSVSASAAPKYRRSVPLAKTAQPLLRNPADMPLMVKLDSRQRLLAGGARAVQDCARAVRLGIAFRSI